MGIVYFTDGKCCRSFMGGNYLFYWWEMFFLGEKYFSSVGNVFVFFKDAKKAATARVLIFLLARTFFY